MDVSIIIVNYNTKELIHNCLKSIYDHTKDLTFEVIVSDNGSVDGSIEMIKSEFPEVILIENNTNLGFGAANNCGLRIAKGKYIFYLNSDTVLLNNAVKIFFDYWENADNKNVIGALGANLMDENHNIIHSYGPFPSFVRILNYLFRRQVALILKGCIPYFDQIRLNNSKLKSYEGQVDYIIGADLFLLNDENALFDERFFMYVEEVDLQYKISLKNKQRIIIMGPEIVHLGEGSDKEKNMSLIQRYASFGKIYIDISTLFFMKLHSNKLTCKVLKIFYIFSWLNPFIIKNTRKYFKT